MVLSIQQHQGKYVSAILDVYEKAKELYPEIDDIDILVDSKIVPELRGTVHVSKGTEEDLGKYKISIKFFNSDEVMYHSMSLGLALVYYDYKYGEIVDIDDMSQEERETFEKIYHSLYDSKEV